MGFDSGGFDLEHLGDLGDGEVMAVAQEQGGPLLGGQAVEGAVKVADVLLSGQLAIGPGLGRGARIEFGRPGVVAGEEPSQPAPAQGAHTQVGEHPVEPLVRGVGISDLLASFTGPSQGFLDRVLGLHPVAQEVTGDAKTPRCRRYGQPAEEPLSADDSGVSCSHDLSML